MRSSDKRKEEEMNDQEYNGWSNRETWATALHINNDQYLYENARDYTKEELAGHNQDEAINPYFLGEVLQNWIEGDLLTLENISGNFGLFNMLTDIGSLYRVNWREIADSFLSEMKVNN
jgi:hypothetical protein